MAPPDGRGQPRPDSSACFSPREREVIAALRESWPLHEIAAKLKITPKTLKTHIARMFQKAGVHSVRELIAAQPRRAPGPQSDRLLNRRLEFNLSNLELALDEAELLSGLLLAACDCTHARQAGLWRVISAQPPRLAAWNDIQHVLEPNAQLLASILARGFRLSSAPQLPLQPEAWRSLEAEDEGLAVIVRSLPQALVLVLSRPQERSGFNHLHLAAVVLLARAAEARLSA